MLKALKPKRKMTLTTPKTRGTNVWLISTPRVALAPTEVAALAAVRAISSSTSFGVRRDRRTGRPGWRAPSTASWRAPTTPASQHTTPHDRKFFEKNRKFFEKNRKFFEKIENFFEKKKQNFKKVWKSCLSQVDCYFVKLPAVYKIEKYIQSPIAVDQIGRRQSSWPVAEADRQVRATRAEEPAMRRKASAAATTASASPDL
ncbi:unnamed protein product [Nesidiocoris tenuis]|uniref:Uncharacterized protein n=1 Tax=Nesidiocoris tenuis TaxID=355587 RepID=A0A6H5FTN7_9HEMI|nr:unnamed protein product [Nesidiocoris tenuis]